MANYSSSVRLTGASAGIAGRSALLALAAATLLAACTAPHPAPIVRRDSPGRSVATPPPAASAPAAAPPVVAAPPAPAVETMPVQPSSVELRPLPGSGGTAAPAASNLLKSEPSALKRPYSDALLAELKAAQADAPPTLAMAPATAPAAAPPAAPAPTAPSAAPPATAPDAGAAASESGFIWPAAGQVVQDFAQPSSMGLSIAGKPGDPIVAASDGRVIFSGPGPRGYGNLLIVKHDSDTLSVYAHNRTLLVKEGQSVKRGQRIAELGSSGTDRPQLHFEIRKQGKPVDPRKYLPQR